MRGAWAAAADEQAQVSVLSGLRAQLGEAVLHAAAVSVEGSDLGGVAAAVGLCDDADVVVLCVGESVGMSGEAASRARLDLPGCQRELATAVLDRAAILASRWVVILFSGRPWPFPGCSNAPMRDCRLVPGGRSGAMQSPTCCWVVCPRAPVAPSAGRAASDRSPSSTRSVPAAVRTLQTITTRVGISTYPTIRYFRSVTGSRMDASNSAIFV